MNAFCDDCRWEELDHLFSRLRRQLPLEGKLEESSFSMFVASKKRMSSEPEVPTTSGGLR